MLKNYIHSLQEIADKIDQDILKRAIKIINSTIKKNNKIFICGNGGSAAIASHALCDWVKRLFPQKICRMYDLTSNGPFISAISNDIGHDDIFSHQLKILSKKNDICIFISSSGNSKNIIKGIKYAKKKGIKTIAVVGFKGGAAKKFADISIHFKTNTYEHHEDLSQILMHYFYLKLREIKN
jgi:phosphoheptose isomerase